MLNKRPHNERNAGRKPLPVERKKVAKPVYLVPSEIEYLVEKYGDLTTAIRLPIINGDYHEWNEARKAQLNK